MENRLRQLRTEKNLTLVELSTQLNKTGRIVTSPDGLAKYERSVRNPNKKKWQAIADFYGVSPDYLKGYGFSKKDLINILIDSYVNRFSDNYGPSIVFKNVKHKFLRNIVETINTTLNVDDINIHKVQWSFVSSDYKWWSEKFDFIFLYPPVKRLLITHDNYELSEVQSLLLDAIERKRSINMTK